MTLQTSEVPLLSIAITDQYFQNLWFSQQCCLRFKAFLDGVLCHWASISQRFDGSLCLQNVRKHSPSDRLPHPTSLDLYLQQI
jgi:hypothetical protein